MRGRQNDLFEEFYSKRNETLRKVFYVEKMWLVNSEALKEISLTYVSRENIFTFEVVGLGNQLIANVHDDVLSVGKMFLNGFRNQLVDHLNILVENLCQVSKLGTGLKC